MHPRIVRLAAWPRPHPRPQPRSAKVIVLEARRQARLEAQRSESQHPRPAA